MSRILLADDSPVQLLTCRHILSGHGFEVVTAVDGLEAWDQLCDSTFDLLISDILMPRMDGYQLLSAVKEEDDMQHMPVVLLTGSGEEEQVLAQRAVGASAVLTKPISSWALLETVQGLLGGCC